MPDDAVLAASGDKAASPLQQQCQSNLPNSSIGHGSTEIESSHCVKQLRQLASHKPGMYTC